MHSNRTRPERERGWLGCWMRGGLVVGVVLCSGVGARGYIVATPWEELITEDGKEQSSIAPKPSVPTWVHLARLLSPNLWRMTVDPSRWEHYRGLTEAEEALVTSSCTDESEGVR